MQLLLDTNVVVWLLTSNRAAVSDDAVSALSNPQHAIAVSAVSVWEIAIKRSLGKLRIDDGWARAISRLDFDAMPVNAIHAERVEHLPWHHRDPFDRLLVAQAQIEGRAIVTADDVIPQYEIQTVW